MVEVMRRRPKIVRRESVSDRHIRIFTKIKVEHREDSGLTMEVSLL